ncbi:MAG: DUF308 domain-containing protein [Tannerellaceae bacterium]|nr:DUF308 domain-containing protein [Tannerellaceae bacterium]MCD7914708.1 DUF308 domain-containing protein [Tannerellaceae bacterium]
MKAINNSILRSILGIVLGLVLIVWPEVAVTYLVILIGIFFIIPGLYSLISYFLRDKSISSAFPLAAAGSILLGLLLVCTPVSFVHILMYLLGAVLLVAGIQQIALLILARKWHMIPWGFFIVPVLIFITGIMILTYPFETATHTFMVFGIAILFYGVCELVNWYKFRPESPEEL